MPATVVDALIVTLGLDASKYTQAQKDALDALKKVKVEGTKTTSDIEKQGVAVGGVLDRLKIGWQALVGRQKTADIALKNTADTARRTALDMSSKGGVAAEFFSKVENKAQGLLGAMVGAGGLVAYVASATTGMAALGRTATNLGMSVEGADAIGKVIEVIGGNADAARGSVQSLFDRIAAAKVYGDAALAGTMGAIHADMYRDSQEEILLKFAAARNAPGMDQGRFRLIGHQLGYGNDLINEAAKGRANMEKDLADAHKRGLVDKAMADRSQALYEAFTKASQRAEHLAAVMLGPFQEGLTAVLNAMTKFMLDHPNISSGIEVGGAVGVTAAVVWLKKLLFGRAAGAVAGAATGGEVAAGAATGAEVAAGVAGAGVLGTGLTLAGLLVAIGFTAKEALRISGAGAGEDDFLKAHRDGAGPASPAAMETGDALVPRGIRNNNPGNLNYAGQEGATLEPGAGGRFARFNTMAEGVAALGRQLQLYASRGNDTIAGIIAKYAPGNENNTAGYIAHMIASTGFGAGQHLNFNDPATLAAMERGIVTMENGRRYAGLVGGEGGTRTQTVMVNGPVVIHTQATDAKGIATAFRGEMSGRRFAAQANVGLS